MKLTEGRGHLATQWYPGQLAIAKDLNRISYSQYQALVDTIATSVVPYDEDGSGPDVVLSGMFLEWDSGLTMQLKPGITISFAGSYYNETDGWGFQADPGAAFIVVLGSEENVAVNPGGAQDRIDTIQMRPVAKDIDEESRKFKDPITGGKSVSNVFTRIEFGSEFQWKQGTEGSGSAPTVDPGWIKIAEVDVPAGASVISQSNIRDVRRAFAWTIEAGRTMFQRDRQQAVQFDSGDTISSGDSVVLDAGNRGFPVGISEGSTNTVVSKTSAVTSISQSVDQLGQRIFIGYLDPDNSDAATVEVYDYSSGSPVSLAGPTVGSDTGETPTTTRIDYMGNNRFLLTYADSANSLIFVRAGEESGGIITWLTPAVSFLDDVAPSGSNVYDFNGDYLDTEGTDPWDTKTALAFTTNSRFGSHALTSTISTALSADPVAAYRLDGDATDASGNGHDGVATDITYVDGVAGQAASFNGTSSEIELPFVDALFPGSGSMTVAFWFRSTSTGSFERIYAAGSSGGIGQYFFVQKSVTDIWRFEVSDGVSARSLDLSTTYNDGAWHLFVATIDRGTEEIRFNVDNGAESRTSGLVGFGSIDKNRALFFGSSGGNTFYQGDADEPRIFNYALSEAEIDLLYNYPSVANTSEAILEDSTNSQSSQQFGFDLWKYTSTLPSTEEKLLSVSGKEVVLIAATDNSIKRIDDNDPNTELWSTPYDNSTYSNNTHDGVISIKNGIYITTLADGSYIGYLWALSISDGSTIWGPSSLGNGFGIEGLELSADGDSVFIASGNQVYSKDVQTGSTNWNNGTGEPYGFYDIHLTEDKTRLFVYSKQKMYEVSKSDGSIVNSFSMDLDSFKFACNNDNAFFPAEGEAYDLNNGSLAFSCSAPGADVFEYISGIDISFNDGLFAVWTEDNNNGEDHLSFFRTSDGAYQWQVTLAEDVYSHIFSDQDGYMYASDGNNSNNLQKVNISTQSVEWTRSDVGGFSSNKTTTITELASIIEDSGNVIFRVPKLGTDRINTISSGWNHYSMSSDGTDIHFTVGTSELTSLSMPPNLDTVQFPITLRLASSDHRIDDFLYLNGSFIDPQTSIDHFNSDKQWTTSGALTGELDTAYVEDDVVYLAYAGSTGLLSQVIVQYTGSALDTSVSSDLGTFTNPVSIIARSLGGSDIGLLFNPDNSNTTANNLYIQRYDSGGGTITTVDNTTFIGATGAGFQHDIRNIGYKTGTTVIALMFIDTAATTPTPNIQAYTYDGLAITKLGSGGQFDSARQTDFAFLAPLGRKAVLLLYGDATSGRRYLIAQVADDGTITQLYVDTFDPVDSGDTFIGEPVNEIGMQTLYIDSTDSDAKLQFLKTPFRYDGIARKDYSPGDVGLMQIDGGVTGFDSILPGRTYYLDVNTGEITVTPNVSNIFIPIGIGLEKNNLKLIREV